MCVRLLEEPAACAVRRDDRRARDVTDQKHSQNPRQHERPLCCWKYARAGWAKLVTERHSAPNSCWFMCKDDHVLSAKVISKNFVLVALAPARYRNYA
jgi:hypothetical protein